MRDVRVVLSCLAALLGSGACAQPTPARPAATTQTGAPIAAHFEGELPPGVTQADVDRWIATATRAVSAYFDGRFPVAHADLYVRFDNRRGKVHGGVTYEGRRINIRVGRETQPADLDRDWTLTHEMFHLGFPSLDEQYHWMEEGLSVYLEPIARARIGNMPVDQFWRETIEGMPQGLPEAGDRGLNRTHTWGRTYWGGALFWMLADVRIREKTQNRKSLDTAIHAIVAAGGDGSVHWPIERVLAAADKATGTSVVSDLFAELAEKPTAPDLSALWSRLGVRLAGSQVSYDEAAPLTEIRRSLTSP
jgi:hypothetical protein